jgi:low temperature requirement protein LtrA
MLSASPPRPQLSWVPLILGAMLGGDAQTALWIVAFLVDRIGARIVAALGGLTLRSPSHIAERHGLVLIIALGESLVSVGAGAGAAVTHWPVLSGALLGLISAFCLWWLYFVIAASPAGRALEAMEQQRQVKTATNAYSLTHFLLIAGIVYLALGVEEILHYLARARPGHFAGTQLDWTATTALYGGLVVYLVGRILFLRFTVGHTPRSQVVAACIALVLLPVARFMPALDALGLLTAFLVALVGYERIGA